MTRRLLGAPGLVVVVIVALVSAVWLRNTFVQIEKLVSDRALKRDITPVRW